MSVYLQLVAMLAERTPVNISYSEKKNDVSIKIKEHNEIVDKLILNMIHMLKDIENDYPNHVEIREEN